MLIQCPAMSDYRNSCDLGQQISRKEFSPYIT